MVCTFQLQKKLHQSHQIASQFSLFHLLLSIHTNCNSLLSLSLLLFSLYFNVLQAKTHTQKKEFQKKTFSLL